MPRTATARSQKVSRHLWRYTSPIYLTLRNDEGPSKSQLQNKNENQRLFIKSRISCVITYRLCSGAKFARCKSITGPFFSSPDRRLPRLLRQGCSRQSRAVSRIVENAKSERPDAGTFHCFTSSGRRRLGLLRDYPSRDESDRRLHAVSGPALDAGCDRLAQRYLC